VGGGKGGGGILIIGEGAVIEKKRSARKNILRTREGECARENKFGLGRGGWVAGTKGGGKKVVTTISQEKKNKEEERKREEEKDICFGTIEQRKEPTKKKKKPKTEGNEKRIREKGGLKRQGLFSAAKKTGKKINQSPPQKTGWGETQSKFYSVNVPTGNEGRAEKRRGKKGKKASWKTEFVKLGKDGTYCPTTRN